MIGFKSKLLNATLALTAAIPLATAGLFTSAGSAQAYTGGFNYSTSDRNPSDKVTLSTLSKNSVNFLPDPGAILLTDQTGDFTSNSRGFIKSFQTNPFISPSGFIDVGALDGIKLLSLTSLDPATFASGNAGIDITFNFNGLFEDGSKATGHIVFVTQDTNAQATYNNGGIINASFTGLAVTTVPEPAALLGLGAVGAVMAMSRRRKSVIQ
ncbi:MAG: PEP-CTERM sorting domain-containing protein [Nostoc sp. NOS(2021)]|uniref:PEP-CTERM sorting domain-containing protein n=1 Tax=Nostoc sp. NOS(2021) TaxID=2815407 RepID=UPI0025DF6813|nr:PEP-CTERM sorting domain-containing protein [Nostoc sp. NOS(2021)]MBN3896897.1 PEP-CTERM sorting domain-containing protein [Nostoc sp. NOS(2021)]